MSRKPVRKANREPEWNAEEAEGSERNANGIRLSQDRTDDLRCRLEGRSASELAAHMETELRRAAEQRLSDPDHGRSVRRKRKHGRRAQPEPLTEQTPRLA